VWLLAWEALNPAEAEPMPTITPEILFISPSSCEPLFIRRKGDTHNGSRHDRSCVGCHGYLRRMTSPFCFLRDPICVGSIPATNIHMANIPQRKPAQNPPIAHQIMISLTPL
jgi:hypothetical protein